MFGPIMGEAARKALMHELDEQAAARESAEARAELDAEELRDLERSSYLVSPATADPGRARHRSIIDRLFRRG